MRRKTANRRTKNRPNEEDEDYPQGGESTAIRRRKNSQEKENEKPQGGES
jgi:hypothetical protein